MTITIRKAISACSALWVIWLPQVGPIEETLTCALVSPKAWLRPSCTLKSFALESDPVCTCHDALLPLPTCWTIASWPPPELVTVLRTWAMVAWWSVNWSTEPPLKSTLKLSPRPASAPMLISRMSPEMAYQRRRLLTNSTETSPRYSLPPPLPSRDITPPSLRSWPGWWPGAVPSPATARGRRGGPGRGRTDRKSTRLNSSHLG